MYLCLTRNFCLLWQWLTIFHMDILQGSVTLCLAHDLSMTVTFDVNIKKYFHKDFESGKIVFVL